VSDAVKVGDGVTGRHPDGTGPWLVVASPTPGLANAVDLCADIVINEIMYHPLSVPRSDAAQGSVSLFDERATTKVLVPQDDNLGRRWTGGDEPFDDRNWTAGLGTGVGYEAGSGYEPYIDTTFETRCLDVTPSISNPVRSRTPPRLTTDTESPVRRRFLAFLNGELSPASICHRGLERLATGRRRRGGVVYR
jgi:hypothetical protein